MPFVAVALTALTTLAAPQALQQLRNAVFDQYQRWQPRSYNDPPVRIIDIDDESLRRFGQWPWPRSLVATLVSELNTLQPASVALDIVFAEPDRTSPSRLAFGHALPEATANYLKGLPDHDDLLAQALAGGNVAVGFALTHERASAVAEATSDAMPAIKARFVLLGDPPFDQVPRFSTGVPSLTVLQQAAAGQGALTFVPDTDGVIRKVPLLMNLGGQLVPSLTAEALRLAVGASNYVVRTAGNGGGVVDLSVGRDRIGTDASGALWVHYTEPVAARSVAAWKVLTHAVPASEVAGRVVLIGTSAQGLLDLRFSPRGQIIPGVEIHAQALEQILSGQHLGRPGWAPAAELIATLVGGTVVGVMAMLCGAATSILGLAAVLGLLCSTAWLAFTHLHLLLDPAATSLALLVVFVPTTLARHLLSERRQRWVKQAFARYVSPNLVDYLIAHPGALELGGKRQHCSFVFADLAGFTPLMESMEPAAAVTVLNAYLDRMIAIAFENEGTLDRIVGDSVAIVFSAPVEQVDHAQRALRCAMQMKAFARAYVDGLARDGIQFCETRIGVHTGEVTVGNFGGSTIFDYRALGDPVNTASRLEGANKQLGTLVCVSEVTLAACPDASARPIGRLSLVGRSESIMVFEPLQAEAGHPGDLEYAAAFDLMRSGSTEAASAFAALECARPADALVRLHAARLRAGDSGDLIELRMK